MDREFWAAPIGDNRLSGLLSELWEAIEDCDDPDRLYKLHRRLTLPNDANMNYEKCDGTGFLDYRGFSMGSCVWCSGKGTIEESSKVAVASLHGRSGKSLDSLGADGQEVATVNNSLTVQAQASDAITLLYTHGLITSAMRDREKLANL